MHVQTVYSFAHPSSASSDSSRLRELIQYKQRAMVDRDGIMYLPRKPPAEGSQHVRP